MSPRPLILLSALAALVCYGVLAFYTFRGLIPAAEGLWPFDLRVFGYDLAAAETYLAALGAPGRALIEGPIATWDTAFPVAFAIFLALSCLSQGPGRLARIGALTALAYLAADLAENAAIRRLVAGPVPPDPLAVSGASLLTQLKYAALAATGALLLAARSVRGPRR